jgi:hypothetical protein
MEHMVSGSGDHGHTEDSRFPVEAATHTLSRMSTSNPSNLPGPSSPADVIWQRTIDSTKQKLRVDRFVLFFVLPVAVIAVVMALVAGPASALGLLIATGLFGLLLWLWVFLTNVNERQNATIRLVDGVLICGQRRVNASSVASFTTYSSKLSGPFILHNALSIVLYHSKRMQIDTGNVVFRMSDGSTAHLMWPSMPPEQINGVREAIERVLPGRGQPSER